MTISSILFFMGALPLSLGIVIDALVEHLAIVE